MKTCLADPTWKQISKRDEERMTQVNQKVFTIV